MHDFFEALNNHARSPILGGIIIAFVLWNWGPLLILAFSTHPIEMRVANFKDNLNRSDYLWPLFLGIVLWLVQPYFKLFYEFCAIFANKKRSKIRIDQDISKKEYEEHRMRRIQSGQDVNPDDIQTEIDQTVKGDKTGSIAQFLGQQGRLAYAKADYPTAQIYLEQARDIVKQEQGTVHEDYAIALNNLAVLYEAQEKYDAAEPLFQQAIDITKSTLGTDHEDYARGLNNLAGLYYAQGNNDAAEPLFEQALHIFETALGSDHPNTKAVRGNYERFLAKRGGD